LDHPREDKPEWAAVPSSVKDAVEQLLDSRVRRAVRIYGGYAPSATFVLTLDSGPRAFLKATFPTPADSGIHWVLKEEERVYENLMSVITPWAPGYLGSVRAEGWHGLLMEAVVGEKMPPWTGTKARRAARSYAEFHATTIGRALPEWLPTRQHAELAGYWRAIASDPAARDRLAALAGEERSGASRWLTSNASRLAAESEALSQLDSTRALLHFDTRSDNVRLQGNLLRIFDWPFACVGPPEFDLAAFAQSVTSEGGPESEQIVAWYSEVRSADPRMLAASVVALSGYFADRAPQASPLGLPRLRSVQRSQLKASLSWAVRLLELPEATWLKSVSV
jgi:hypothetical protein